MNIKAVRKHQGLACGKIRKNALQIERLLFLIVDKYHNDVCFLGSVRGGRDLQTRFLSLLPALGALVQTNHYLNAAVLEIQRVSVTL